MPQLKHHGKVRGDAACFPESKMLPEWLRGSVGVALQGTWDLPFALLVLLTLCNNPALAEDYLGLDETGAANSQAQNNEVGESDRAEKNTFFVSDLDSTSRAAGALEWRLR